MNIEKGSFAGEEGKKKFTEEILSKTGLESKPVNDSLFYHESEESGGIIIKVGADSMLEEDIAQMEKGETILNESMHHQVIQESFRDTLKTIGSYIPQDKLERLFPDLNLANLESYDFLSSKIKVFVLSYNDYDFLYNNLYPNSKKKYTGGLALRTVATRPSSLSATEMRVDMSENKVVIVRELQKHTKDYLEKTNVNLTRELAVEEKKLISIQLKNTICHELLHTLDVSNDLPRRLNEGITEWYSQQIVNGNIRGNDATERSIDKDIVVGYQSVTEGVSIMMSSMLESGVATNTINKAFISSDMESRQKVLDFFIKRYGKENTENIMGWKFESDKEFLQYITDLESNQDSDIGRFLRNYKK